MWTLEVQSPETLRQTFRLSPGLVRTIGRSTGANFIVDAPLVSRLHCQLEWGEGGDLTVADLGSTNGTFVNDLRIQQAELQDGDRLRVGRAELIIKRS